MWRSQEHWVRLCDTPEAAERAMRDATTALRLATGRPGMRVKRYPRRTLFVGDSQRRVAVTMRVTYMHEDNPTYAKRFARNNLAPRQSEPTVTT